MVTENEKKVVCKTARRAHSQKQDRGYYIVKPCECFFSQTIKSGTHGQSSLYENVLNTKKDGCSYDVQKFKYSSQKKFLIVLLLNETLFWLLYLNLCTRHNCTRLQIEIFYTIAFLDDKCSIPVNLIALCQANSLTYSYQFPLVISFNFIALIIVEITLFRDVGRQRYTN